MRLVKLEGHDGPIYINPEHVVAVRKALRDTKVETVSGPHTVVGEPAQIARLRALQPFPGRPPEFDRQFGIPDFRALLQWAGTAARQRGQRIRLYPELKQPARFAALGLDPVPAFLDALDACPPEVEIWLQCFELDALRRVGERCAVPLFLLLDAGADWRAAIAAADSGLAVSGLAESRPAGARIAGFGVHKSLLWDETRPSGLIDAAHARGLAVHAWTYRDDRVDSDPSRAFGDIEQELSATFQLGVDGVFCDFPATAVAVRDRCDRQRLLAAHAQQGAP